MASSLYSVQTPLRNWRLGSESKRIEGELAHGAKIEASIEASESFQARYVQCYGLQIFWSSRAVSNVFPPPNWRPGPSKLKR
jgi:hypothetical protein